MCSFLFLLPIHLDIQLVLSSYRTLSPWQQWLNEKRKIRISQSEPVTLHYILNFIVSNLQRWAWIQVKSFFLSFWPDLGSSLEARDCIINLDFSLFEEGYSDRNKHWIAEKSNTQSLSYIRFLSPGPCPICLSLSLVIRNKILLSFA